MREVNRRKERISSLGEPKTIRVPGNAHAALSLLSRLEGKSIGKLLKEMADDMLSRRYPETTDELRRKGRI